jgi:signal transduction histidine kinase
MFSPSQEQASLAVVSIANLLLSSAPAQAISGENIMKNLRPFLIRYGTGALSPALALILALLLWPVIKPFAMPLFLSAIVISAWQGGKGPGLVATLVSGVIIDYVFIPPQYRISAGWDDLGRLAVFGLEGFLLSWLVVSRKRVEHEVRKSREDLRALSAHLQSGIEAERTRIAREIHDELGQSLTGLKFDVSWLRDQATESTGEPERMKLDATLKNIDTAIQSVRRIATELRPPVLDTLGLTAAIEWQAADFQNRTGIECQLKPMAEDIRLDREGATAVFRVFQESLTNVARHAQATKVQVGLERVNGHLRLRLADNGKGIGDMETSGTHSLGILGMHERVRLLNGEMSISGEKGRGTVINVDIPLIQSQN